MPFFSNIKKEFENVIIISRLRNDCKINLIKEVVCLVQG